MECRSPVHTGSMALIRTPQAPVVQLLVCHKLLQVPLPARLRQVRMLVLLARPHRLSGQVTRVRTTQITGVVSVLQVLPFVHRSSNRCARIGYYPQQTAAGQQGAADVQQGH
jgi:hypothetical protein